jgi:hypothetical protein
MPCFIVYRLEIEMGAGVGHRLIAPKEGEMSREIRERIVCGASFRFTKNGKILFEQESKKASLEYAS